MSPRCCLLTRCTPCLITPYSLPPSARVHRLNILFMLVCGAIVNGPYALITTAVSADLGTHKSLQVCSALPCPALPTPVQLT